MFRAARPLARLAQRPSPFPSISRRAACSAILRPSRPPLALVAARFASSDSKNPDPPPPKPQIDYEKEKRLGEELLETRPSEVSSDSSVRHVMEGSPRKPDADLGGGLKHDIGIIQDTFRLSKVPKESHFLGLAGTLPYLATSLSTVFLAWDLSKELPTGNVIYDAIFINHDTAHYLLSIIEPLQLGYGAVIISFLGAIHWGLEYAEKTPLRERTNFRYGIGVAASVIAWPTVLMPLEYALTAQFMAFVALYFVDSRAATRGWAPPWYGMYRFLLTAMVGLAILVSLVGRAKISTHGRLTTQGLSSTMTDPGIADHSKNWSKIEAEEMEKLKKEKEEAEKKAKKEAAAKKKAAKKNEGKDEKSEGKGDEKKQDKKDRGAQRSDEGEQEKSDDTSKDASDSDDDKTGAESKDDDKSNEGNDESKEKETANNNNEDEDKSDDEPKSKEDAKTKDKGKDDNARDDDSDDSDSKEKGDSDDQQEDGKDQESKNQGKEGEKTDDESSKKSDK